MYQLFHSLKKEKQDRIINAALSEFAKKGFKDASTNEIVKQAEISKGSLFNYFAGKKALYLYLMDYAHQTLTEMYEKFDSEETDLFKRLEKVGFIKLRYQQKHPKLFDFLVTAKNEEADDVKDYFKQNLAPLSEEGVKKLYKNIDYSKFREDIDIEKAMEILTWTMFGFGEKSINELSTFEKVEEKYIDEWGSYSDILKQSFYK